MIINVSSHGVFQASPAGIADYAVAKGGLVTLTFTGAVLRVDGGIVVQ